MANKTCTFMMPEELWQTLKLISSEEGGTTKSIVNTVLKDNLMEYAKKKNFPEDTLTLIEKKLKAME